MREKRNPRGYWTKERCLKEALKYNSRVSFQKNSKGAQLSAYRHGWLDEICKHMERPINHNKIWYFENCKNEALKYNKESDFRKKSLGAYKAAIYNKWLDIICSHMIKIKSTKKYWTKEIIFSEAIKYNNKNEFIKYSKAAYIAASKRNLLPEVCAHMESCGNVLLRCIYVYEFPDNHVYVGLTCNMKRRYREHQSKSPVSKHIGTSGLVPKHFIVSDGYINVREAQKLEKDTYLQYLNNGWVMLNSNRTGGVGSHKLPKKII